MIKKEIINIVDKSVIKESGIYKNTALNRFECWAVTKEDKTMIGQISVDIPENVRKHYLLSIWLAYFTKVPS